MCIEKDILYNKIFSYKRLKNFYFPLPQLQSKFEGKICN